MIDLHCHILPGIDDGAQNLEISLAMARIAVDDGIRVTACTPHIYPGLYMNDTAGIRAARDALQAQLDQHGIPLTLTTGADVHLVPGLLDGLRSGIVPSLHDTRYLLLEPSHHVAPPRFAESVFQLVGAGYTPVITHPERLSWIEDHFDTFAELTKQGAWMQVTAGALTGSFGPRIQYWAEKFVGEGYTHILATDAHTNGRRRPVLSEARASAERLLGRDEAWQLVEGRQQIMMADRPPSEAAPLPDVAPRRKAGWISRMFGLA